LLCSPKHYPGICSENFGKINMINTLDSAESNVHVWTDENQLSSDTKNLQDHGIISESNFQQNSKDVAQLQAESNSNSSGSTKIVIVEKKIKPSTVLSEKKQKRNRSLRKKLQTPLKQKPLTQTPLKSQNQTTNNGLKSKKKKSSQKSKTDGEAPTLHATVTSTPNTLQASDIDHKIGDLSNRLSSLKKELSSVARRSTKKKSPVPKSQSLKKMESTQSRVTSLSLPSNSEPVSRPDPEALIASVIRNMNSLATSARKTPSLRPEPISQVISTALRPTLDTEAAKSSPHTQIRSALGAVLDAALQTSTECDAMPSKHQGQQDARLQESRDEPKNPTAVMPLRDGETEEKSAKSQQQLPGASAFVLAENRSQENEDTTTQKPSISIENMRSKLNQWNRNVQKSSEVQQSRSCSADPKKDAQKSVPLSANATTPSSTEESPSTITSARHQHSRLSKHYQNPTPGMFYRMPRVKHTSISALQAESQELSVTLQQRIRSMLDALLVTGSICCHIAVKSQFESKIDSNAEQVKSDKEVGSKVTTLALATPQRTLSLAEVYMQYATEIKTSFDAAVTVSKSVLEHLRTRRRSWNLSFIQNLQPRLETDELARGRERRSRIFVPKTKSSASMISSAQGTNGNRDTKAAATLLVCQGCSGLLDPDDDACSACRTPIATTLKWQSILS